MAKKYLTLAIVILLGTSLLACRPTVPALTAGGTTTAAATRADTHPIVGRVDFSGIRATQATVGDVLSTATIALYDALTGETRTSTVTDATGNFTLSMPGFTPVENATYVLEAIKGLGAQLPGRTAPRLRTVLKYTSSGWQSLTSSVAGGTLVINAHTTAVAIASALDPVGLPIASAMGKVGTGSPSALNGTPTFAGHPDAELDAMAADVITTLSREDDPVAVTNAIKPSLQGMTPSSGGANQVVSLTGVGFTGGTTTVKMNGVAVPTSNVLIVTGNQIVFTVPVGAGTGNVVVNTSRGGDSNGLPFTVPNSAAVSIQAISPNPARPNASVTVTGTGYSTVLINNSINVNGITVTPDFANTTSLIFRVPINATSGNVNVTVDGQTSNNYYLTVESLTTPQATSLFPTSIPNKGLLAIKGQNLGPDGSVLIGDFQAKVISWNPNIIRVQVPYLVPSGNQQVTVFAPLGIATQSVTVLDGATVDGWTNVASLPADVGGPGVHAYMGGEKIWVWGGVGSTKVYYMNLNADGSFKDAAWTAAPFSLPEGTYQDDNPNSRTQIKNRIYYTVTNNRAAANKSHINFASLDPYTGDVLGFAYDPINDLPPTWVGKDLALVSSDRYVYIMGHGPSCTGDGVSCGNNPVGTMQARLLDSGNIGQWETGPNQKPYGEDGLPFILGDVIYQVGGTSGVSQQCILDAEGRMSATSGWATMSVPLIPDGDNLSCVPNMIGRYYYFWDMWSARRSYKGFIVDDLIPQAGTELTGALDPSGAGVPCGLAHVDVQAGNYVYLISSNQGGGGQYQVVCRGTIH